MSNLRQRLAQYGLPCLNNSDDLKQIEETITNQGRQHLHSKQSTNCNHVIKKDQNLYENQIDQNLNSSSKIDPLSYLFNPFITSNNQYVRPDPVSHETITHPSSLNSCYFNSWLNQSKTTNQNVPILNNDDESNNPQPIKLQMTNKHFDMDSSNLKVINEWTNQRSMMSNNNNHHFSNQQPLEWTEPNPLMLNMSNLFHKTFGMQTDNYSNFDFNETNGNTKNCLSDHLL